MPQKLKKSNVKTSIPNPTHRTGYTYNAFTLPVLDEWESYFLNVCTNLKSIPYVKNAHITSTPHLYVTTSGANGMAHVNFIVKKEIETFKNMRKQSRRRCVKNETTTDHINVKNGYESHISNVMHRILQRKRQRPPKTYGMNPVTSFQQFKLIRKRNFNRRNWYKLDRKPKRTKGLIKYIRQQTKYHRHHPPVSLYRRQKRSSFEYKQTKVIGRKRDKLKVRRAWLAKRKFKSNRCGRKSRYPYKHTTTFGSHTKSSNTPVVKNESRVKQPEKPLLNSYFHFPQMVINSVHLLLTRGQGKILLRYSNQHVFIYAIPANRRTKPSSKYLFAEVSTLGTNQLAFFDQQQRLSTISSQTKVKKQTFRAQRRETPSTTLVGSRNHESQFGRSGKPQKMKKCKAQPKKTTK